MIFIIGFAIVIYFVFFAWTWQSLGFIEKPKKVAFIIIGTVVMFVITLVIFQISKGNIQYQNVEMEKSVRKDSNCYFYRG